MLNKGCTHCQQLYRIEDVRVDAHWNGYSTEPAYCHCPHCDAVLDVVYPDAVDLAKHLKPSYILVWVCFFLVFGLGAATGSLGYVAPLVLLFFGAWLAKSSLLKDHRIIGWILMILSVVVFLTVNTNLISGFANG